MIFMLPFKRYDPEFCTYRLGFPNEEVEDGFFRFLLPFYASVDKVEAPFHIRKFVEAMKREHQEE